MKLLWWHILSYFKWIHTVCFIVKKYKYILSELSTSPVWILCSISNCQMYKRLMNTHQEQFFFFFFVMWPLFEFTFFIHLYSGKKHEYWLSQWTLRWEKTRQCHSCAATLNILTRCWPRYKIPIITAGHMTVGD